MTIYPLLVRADGRNAIVHICPEVFTSYKGQRVFVGSDYRKRTAAEVIAIAYANAIIRQQIRGLCDKMTPLGARGNTTLYG